MSGSMEQGAERLLDHLGLDPLKGSVGIDETQGVYHVYVYGKWTGRRIAEFDGRPVEWHVGMGRPQRLAGTDDAAA